MGAMVDRFPKNIGFVWLVVDHDRSDRNSHHCELGIFPLLCVAGLFLCAACFCFDPVLMITNIIHSGGYPVM
jgi:hypothetical protein